MLCNVRSCGSGYVFELPDDLDRDVERADRQPLLKDIDDVEEQEEMVTIDLKDDVAGELIVAFWWVGLTLIFVQTLNLTRPATTTRT